jgi:hypothetical protein
MTEQPLGVLIVEDEVLLAVELGVPARGGRLPLGGHAMSSDEAVTLAHDLHPDLALVDVHLRDGPTGVEVARKIHDDCGAVALFMTANVKRLPDDFAGACGVIGKPYSEHGVKTALEYLTLCMRHGPSARDPCRRPGPVAGICRAVGPERRPAESRLIHGRLARGRRGRRRRRPSVDHQLRPADPQDLEGADASSVSLRTYIVTVTGFTCWTPTA